MMVMRSGLEVTSSVCQCGKGILQRDMETRKVKGSVLL